MGGAKAFPLMQPDSCRMVHTRACRGIFVAMLYPAGRGEVPAPSTLRRAAGCTAPYTRRTPRSFPLEPSCRALHFRHQFRSWQAEEAVANLPLRVAVRLHSGHQV